MKTYDMTCSCRGGNLDKFIQPHILVILSKRSMYGLEIISELEKMNMFIGHSPDPTGVYRYLKKMEADGHLTSEMKAGSPGERPKKFYSVTDEGRRCLASWAVVLGQYSVDIIGLVTEIEDALGK
ncbi:MAG: PadR family transcriptional regulator [Firmicutes bacterium]|nr:PadR family transcriptional regulator [Bacillota bacterium]